MPGARLLALDGLRAIAVGLVLVNHSLSSTAPADVVFHPFQTGPMGVRLFFVLSGFLITGILLTTRSDAALVGASRWGVLASFYARRSLRIFPLAYLALFVAWLVGDASMQRYPEWYLTYTSNILNANVGWHGAMGHFWSLAVEEQFYLLWPLLVLFAPRAWLVPVLVCAIVSAGLMRGVMAAEDEWIAAYVLLWTRGDALAFGGLLAVRPDLRVPALAGAGVLLAVAGAGTEGATHAIVAEWGMILLSAAVVMSVTQGRAAALLSWRPLVMVGTISYGIYVWHQLVPKIVPVLEASLDFGLHMPPAEEEWARLGYVTLATLVLAALSWFLFEKPLNDLRTRIPYVRRASPVARLEHIQQS
jgi:peptidoglycan/LPS O-acetylase OafA/YrhL